MRARLFALLMAISSSQAASSETANTDAQAILAQQQGIRADALATKGRYKDLDEARRKQLLAHQDTVTRLLTGVNRTTDLHEPDQIKVFNALEAIQAIVNQAEEDRLICERYKPAGSNRPLTICKSVAQRRAEKLERDAALRQEPGCIDEWNSGACKN